MNRNIIALWVAISVLALIGGVTVFDLPNVQVSSLNSTPESIARGQYVVAAAGCVSCHIDTEKKGSLSGGLAIESEFGTFFAPNITPDLSTGIGGWEAADFIRAIKYGRSPDGSYYFPAFPYKSYAGMRDEDVLDIAVYLLAQEPIAQTVASHEIPWWLSRWMLAGWNVLADILGSSQNLPDDPQLARGAYLARYLGHCGECHTPRNALGISQTSKEFQGALLGESHANAIDAEALKSWSEDDFAFFLFLGMKPDGEFVGGKMEPVIEHNTSLLTDDDRKAMAAFFKRQELQ
jgi:mono/diheme cytochrome c family protein